MQSNHVFFYIFLFQICWKSRDKVKKYYTMINAAESAIKNYKNNKKEFDARTESIENLKNISTEKQKTHIKNIREYENLIAKEDEISKKMKEVRIKIKDIRSPDKSVYLKIMFLFLSQTKCCGYPKKTHV